MLFLITKIVELEEQKDLSAYIYANFPQQNLVVKKSQIYFLVLKGLTQNFD